MKKKSRLTGLSESWNNCVKKRIQKEMCWMKKEMHVDSLRSEYQQIQRSQFDAEKKVAVADTSDTKPAKNHRANRRRKKAT